CDDGNRAVRDAGKHNSDASFRYAGGGGCGGLVPDVPGGKLRYAPGDSGRWGSVMTRRVVITGMGAVSALGSNWREADVALRTCRNAVVYMPSYAEYQGLN